MKKIKKLIVFALFLFAINLAYAQNYDIFSGKYYYFEGEEKIQFEFYNDTYSICENDEKTIPIMIVNKANVDNRFSLDLIGSSWASFNVKEFFLAKNKNGVALLNLKPGQNTNGNYNIKINALSAVGNIRKDLSLSIHVENCYAITLELDDKEDKICGGAKKQYLGEIINEGSQKSDIELEVIGPIWINLDKNAFSIDAANKEKFELNVDVPDNSKGVFNILLSAIVKDIPVKSERVLKLEIDTKYDCYKAEFSDKKIKNHYSNEYAPIKIKNNGLRKATYNVSLEAPEWVKVDAEKLTVNPGQFGNLNLNINPNLDIAEGTYPVKIILRYEDVTYSQNFDVVLSKKQFFKNAKTLLVFYQYYLYVILFVLIVLFIFRKKILNTIKTKYKNYKLRKARLRALEKARQARAKKKLR